MSWWLRLVLKMGALMNRDADASHDEMHGFDYVDRTTIGPIVEAIQRRLARGPSGCQVLSA